jgi:hypothetical protein
MPEGALYAGDILIWPTGRVEYMNRTLLLPLLLLLLCLCLCAAGCSEAGEEPWYTPAPTPEMTIAYTPLPTCPTLTAEVNPKEGTGNEMTILPAVAGSLP